MGHRENIQGEVIFGKQVFNSSPTPPRKKMKRRRTLTLKRKVVMKKQTMENIEKGKERKRENEGAKY